MSQTPTPSGQAHDERAAQPQRRLLSTDAGDELFHRDGTTSIGIDVGGYVFVMPLRDWHALAARASMAGPAPLAAAPARQPLTEAQLERIAVEDEYLLFCDQDSFNQIARAIEAAHGIGATPPAPTAGNEPAALAALRKELKSVQFSLRFYKSRVELLQQWQSRMRDPERTIVCDIIANGQMLPDLSGTRYGIAASAERAAQAPVGAVPPEHIEKVVEGLIRAAWGWGESCGVDGVSFDEQGDSYNQMMRDKAERAKDKVYELLAAAPSPATGTSREAAAPAEQRRRFLGDPTAGIGLKAAPTAPQAPESKDAQP